MNKRFILVFVLSIIFYSLWNMLGVYLGIIPSEPARGDNEPGIEQQVEEQSPPGEVVSDPGQPDQSAESAETTTDEEVTEQQVAIEQTFTALENDEIFIELDNRGGIVSRAYLKNYYSSVKQEKRVQLISSTENYPGEVVLDDGTSTIGLMFEIQKTDENTVVLTHESDALTIVKTYTLTDGFRLEYKVDVSKNNDPYLVVASEGLQPILPGDKLKASFTDFGAVSPKILHIAWSEDGSHETETPSEKMSDDFTRELKNDELVRWAGVKDTYFACVFVPQDPVSNLFTRKVSRFVGRDEEPRIVPTVAVSGKGVTEGWFYMGPIMDQELSKAGWEVENLITYGWAGVLSKWLFLALNFFHDKTGNWGWSIIILTLLIRILLVPLMIPSVKSSFKMRQLQPKLTKLKQKYAGNDLETKQKLQQETFALYKKENVNPFSSCFTALAQMPVFIAYFSLLRNSFYLRQADWMFWIADLSIKDATYILPIFMGVTMFLSTLAMPMPSTDPAQAKMMKIMPVMFSLMFLGMPAGLILYMITSNIFTLIQTYVVKWRFYKE